MSFRCNNIHCREYIRNLSFITLCSHIFCNVCFEKLKKLKSCLACKSVVLENEYIKRESNVDLCLAGYTPEKIFEICKTAINFYTFQTEQDLEIDRVLNEKKEESYVKVNSYLKNSLTKLINELKHKEEIINKLNIALDKERDLNFELSNIIAEKNNEYLQLLDLYERRNIQQYYNMDDIDPSEYD